MSTIDEIMEKVIESQDAAAAYEAEAITGEQLDGLNDGLRYMLAAALADAERKGAEAMRERAAVAAWASGMDQHNGRRGAAQDAREVGSLCAHAIRAVRVMPLPTGDQP